jgi:hypothetical protein
VALSVLWEALRNDALSVADKLAILDAADSALGLGGATLSRPELSPELQTVLAAREKARHEKNWKAADVYRAYLTSAGISLKDRPEGSSWYVSAIPARTADERKKEAVDTYDTLKENGFSLPRDGSSNLVKIIDGEEMAEPSSPVCYADKKG